MLLRDILADLVVVSFFMLIVLKSGVRHSLTIPIMCTGNCSSCGIAVQGGNVCEICSQPSTSDDTSIAQNVAPKGMYHEL